MLFSSDRFQGSAAEDDVASVEFAVVIDEAPRLTIKREQEKHLVFA